MNRLLPSRLIVAASALWLAVGDVCPASEASAGHAEATNFYSDLSFWGLVAFLGFLWVLKQLGWDALTSGMRTREANERKFLADADRLRENAAAQFRKNKGLVEAVDEQVRGMLAEAERDAEHTRREITAVGQREAAATRTRVELEIRRVQGQALHDIFELAANRIADRVEQRLRSGLSAAEQQRLMDAAVQEFTSRQATATA